MCIGRRGLRRLSASHATTPLEARVEARASRLRIVESQIDGRALKPCLPSALPIVKKRNAPAGPISEGRGVRPAYRFAGARDRGPTMNLDLDDDLRALRAEQTPASYELIEPRVLRGIAAARKAREAAPALYAARAAALVGALSLGVATGAAAAVAVAAEGREISAFSVQAELAPSTLLGHQR